MTMAHKNYISDISQWIQATGWLTRDWLKATTPSSASSLVGVEWALDSIYTLSLTSDIRHQLSESARNNFKNFLCSLFYFSAENCPGVGCLGNAWHFQFFLGPKILNLKECVCQICHSSRQRQCRWSRWGWCRCRRCRGEFIVVQFPCTKWMSVFWRMLSVSE